MRPGEESKEPDPLDVDELAGLFEEDGLFESRMEGFEQRPQQVSMVRGIARAFNVGEVFVVEAGTGTGKSLSYLTPALLWAVQNGLRVIVSTNTRNLQEQLFYKDLPFLLDNLGVPFSATLLKGRSNYLCLDRWRQVIRRPEDHLTPERTGGRDSLVVWARETNTGDVAEHAGFNTGANRGLWEKVNGEGSACPRCAVKMRVSSIGPGRPLSPPTSSSSIMRCCSPTWRPTTPCCPGTLISLSTKPTISNGRPYNTLPWKSEAGACATRCAGYTPPNSAEPACWPD